MPKPVKKLEENTTTQPFKPSEVLKTLKPDTGLPKGYLSPSAIGTYLGCPQQYYLRYIEKKQSINVVNLVEGKAVHTVLETNNNYKATQGKDIDLHHLIQCWNDTWSTEAKGVDDWLETTQDAVAVEGERLLQLYHRYYAPNINPKSKDNVEREFLTYVQGVPIYGKIDVVNQHEEQPRVLDYKVSKTAHSIAEAESSIQLGLYVMASDVPHVGYLTLVKAKKEPKVVLEKATRTPFSLRRVEGVVKSVRDAVAKGNFPYADPSTWRCTAKYCGLWYACKQGGKLINT